jgi:hypothetical protein
MLSIKLFRLVFCLFRFDQNIETLCFGIESKQTKQTVSKQTKKIETTLNFLKNTICSLSHCLGWSSGCFGPIETPKLSVSVQNRNNRNKHFVSDSAETNFGSSFGCFEAKLVSKDTLRSTEAYICYRIFLVRVRLYLHVFY